MLHNNSIYIVCKMDHKAAVVVVIAEVATQLIFEQTNHVLLVLNYNPWYDVCSPVLDLGLVRNFSASLKRTTTKDGYLSLSAVS